MNMPPVIFLLGPLDYAALTFFLTIWVGISWRIDKPHQKNPAVSHLMRQYQYRWMEQMVTRDNRVFDSTIVANLRQGTAFFGSAALLAIGGLLAVIGDVGRLSSLAQDLTRSTTPQAIWEFKLLVVLFLLTHGFLKFVWSNRLFGYFSVQIGAMPNDPNDPRIQMAVERAARFAIFAMRAFNRGLRAIYFALGATAWLLGSEALIMAGCVTLFVVWRREFASESRKVLLETADEERSLKSAT